MKNIAVFCGSGIGFKPYFKEAATTVGHYLAQQNIGLVYGGGKIGMMGALADALLEKGGHVTGVIPHMLRHEEVFHSTLNKMIVTDTTSERKVIISKMVDGYIALAGGFGTLDELFEALTLGQLGIENKPIGLLNTNGFFDNTLKQLDVMVAEGFLKPKNRNMLITDTTVDGLMVQMLNYKAPEITHIINKVVS